VRDGHDPQLERAVQVVLSDLEKNPIPTHHKPPYPNYHQGATDTTASPVN
jgi:tricorn protease